MQTISLYLPQQAVTQLEQTARDIGLRRATLTRLVIERWLADPSPLFELPLPKPPAEPELQR